MTLSLKVLGSLLCVVVGISQKSASGCCGHDSQKQASGALHWTEFDAALQQAGALKQPFMVLFTSRELAQTAGEGPSVFKEYEAANGKLPEMTLIDYATGIEPIQRRGVRIFVKLPDTLANRELFKKYDAKPSMVVFIAPDGEKLGSYKGADFSPDKYFPVLDKFEEKMDDWRRHHGIAMVDSK